MPIYTLSNGAITNPVFDRVAADATHMPFTTGTSLSSDDMLVIDALTCPASDVPLGFPALDAGAALLLLDAGDDHKKALAGHIGFRSHGTSRGYRVVKRGSSDIRCYISEVGDSTAPASLYCASGTGNQEQGTVQPATTQVIFENQVETQPMTDQDVDFFVASLKTAAVATNDADTPPDGLIWYTWIYSRSHSFTASGSYNSEADLGPPPSRTISTSLTYTFQGALNNATQSGSFQFLGLQERGIYQNNGMASNTDTSCGWTLGSICPTFNAPASLYWYQSSPSNTNDVSSVTTGSSVTVGFDASTSGGGGNASYTYSNSVTQNITDWYIKQQTTASWIYAQNTPFDGNTTDASKINDSRGWNGLIDTSTFPVISTSSLQFAADAVWKTNSVLTDEISISVVNLMRVDYIMINKVLGLGQAWADWWKQSSPSDSFSFDMSFLA